MTPPAIEDHCPCKRHRLLARYHLDGAFDLMPGARIALVVPGMHIVSGEMSLAPMPGSAVCIRVSCRFLRRSRSWTR